jgi:hypothetical protein
METSPVPEIRQATMQAKLCKVNQHTNLLHACISEQLKNYYAPLQLGNDNLYSILLFFILSEL